jgi:hypothetical protein
MIDLSRLDDNFMGELWRKYFGQSVPLHIIKHCAGDDRREVEYAGYKIAVTNILDDLFDERELKVSVYHYDKAEGIPLELVSDILNQLKTCSNCINFNSDGDDFGGCDKIKTRYVSDHPSELDENSVQLFVDDHLNSYVNSEIMVRGENITDNFDFKSDTAKIYRILCGGDFSCCQHEFKEV